MLAGETVPGSDQQWPFLESIPGRPHSSAVEPADFLAAILQQPLGRILQVLPKQLGWKWGKGQGSHPLLNPDRKGQRAGLLWASCSQTISSSRLTKALSVTSVSPNGYTHGKRRGLDHKPADGFVCTRL